MRLAFIPDLWELLFGLIWFKSQSEQLRPPAFRFPTFPQATGPRQMCGGPPRVDMWMFFCVLGLAWGKPFLGWFLALWLA